MSGLLAGSLPVVVGLLLLLTPAGVAGGASPHPSSGLVEELYQTAYTTEQSNFTVSMEVANTANITFVFFTFCQLSSPLCYLPVQMTPHGTNWYVGTTHRMTSYNGMRVGVHAGYNITIQYANNSTVYEPQSPNPFSNLTVAQSVTGEYMFEMTVRNQTYGLTGKVTDSSTGAAISGAMVTLSPSGNSTTTDASGAYAFTGIPNGSYTLSVTDHGYTLANQTVNVAGTTSVQDFSLLNASNPSKVTPGAPSQGFATLPIVEVALALSVIVVIAVAGVAYSRSRNRSKNNPPTVSDPDTPTPPVGPS